MKIIGLLCVATTVVALGCDQDQDIGGNEGGAGGSGGSSPVGSCLDATCGALCFTCPPNEPECSDPSYLGYCIDGVCLPSQPQCGPFCGDGELNLDAEECDDGNYVDGDGCSGNCTSETPDPCLDKACGEGCMTCPPNEPNCVDPSYQGYCDLQGVCVYPAPTCQ